MQIIDVPADQPVTAIEAQGKAQFNRIARIGIAAKIHLGLTPTATHTTVVAATKGGFAGQRIRVIGGVQIPVVPIKGQVSCGYGRPAAAVDANFEIAAIPSHFRGDPMVKGEARGRGVRWHRQHGAL